MQLPQRFMLESCLLLLTSYSLDNALAQHLPSGEATSVHPSVSVLPDLRFALLHEDRSSTAGSTPLMQVAANTTK